MVLFKMIALCDNCTLFRAGFFLQICASLIPNEQSRHAFFALLTYNFVNLVATSFNIVDSFRMIKYVHNSISFSKESRCKRSLLISLLPESGPHFLTMPIDSFRMIVGLLGQ